jgi:hemolysin activation/secretion protein
MMKSAVDFILQPMIRTNPKIAGKHSPSFKMLRYCHALFLLLFLCCYGRAVALNLTAAESEVSKNSPTPHPTAYDMVAVEANAAPHFDIRAYAIEGKILLSTNIMTRLFSKYTGTNVSQEEIVQAASDLQAEYRHRGYPTMIITIAPRQITNGIITMNVFEGVVPQILVSGTRYLISNNGAVVAANNLSNMEPPSSTGVTNSNAVTPATAGITPPAAANLTPKFTVRSYLITGNSLLSPQTLKSIFIKYMGTNIVVGDIVNAAMELQKEYRNRGYPTVSVTIPQQKIKDGLVKIRVFEGRLSDIIVANNFYFSSNNVMRALPSLHNNQILNGQIFQAELNRANANQDRQIYPKIEPGPVEDTTVLDLDVKDQLPLHAKVELNNDSSPGTPALRLNSSAVYDNLWQQENSLGVQYNFSPELYKSGSQWNGYDLPLVANYSGFYRMPLGNPEPIEDVVASNPGSFGYDEATRKFNLPPASGQPELTFFASRSTIDTGLTTSPNQNIYTASTTNSDGSVVTNSTLNLRSLHQDLTINDDLGFRLNLPVAVSAGFHAGLSGGLDFKNYNTTSSGTNIYTLNSEIIDTLGGTTQTNRNSSTDFAPVAGTVNQLEYLPLSVRYDSGWHDFMGTASFGLGLSGNLWYSSLTQQGSGTNTTYLHGVKSLQSITDSKNSFGHWVVINPSFSYSLELSKNWPTMIRADGQWASEPLISTEQFGAGGVNSVRGYHEGEVFGDTGWHISLEQQTPPRVVGFVSGAPLTIRGSVYMDYADTYLLDPQGRPGSTALWGTGFGGVASIGSHWEARFLFSVPLLRSATTEPYQPFFNFALDAQF